jgi:hypothetical protein
MTLRFTVALLLVALIPAFAAQKETKAPRASRQQQAAPRPQQPQARPQQQAQGRGANAVNGPGMLRVERLAEMSPSDRQKALSKLSPERRQAVMKRLQDYQQLPADARQRAAFEVEKLQSLPPQRQNQVRKSLRQFQDLPEERKSAIGSELDRLNALPEEDRRARMNSEEFRNRYSPAEQQMMSNISEVLPRREEQ